jgi:hypothetical protein
MKTVLTSIVLSTLLCSGIFAQSTLKPYITGASIKVVIKEYAQVSPEIQEGLIAIYTDGYATYVNIKGEYVFGTDFKMTSRNSYRANYFSGGAQMAWRTKEGAFSAAPIIIYPDGKYREFPTGTRNASGMSNDVIAAGAFVEGYALVRRGNLMSATQMFIDKNGNNVFPALNSRVTGSMSDLTVYPLCENRRVFYNAELEMYGYADEKGAIMIKPQFTKAENFSEGLAAVQILDGWNKKWGFIDKTGKLVIPATYDLKPGRFRTGLAAVRIGQYDYEYEMTFINTTGNEVLNRQPWSLNEIDHTFSWVGTGCEKLFIMFRDGFNEYKDVTEAFYYNGNGFGTCQFTMLSGDPTNSVWGFDFPNGLRALNQRGVGQGEIFSPSGAVVFRAEDSDGNLVPISDLTERDLIFCKVRFKDNPHLKDNDVVVPVFMNQMGHVVYYFEAEDKGFEGPAPTLVR